MKFALRQHLGGSGKKHDNTAFQVGWLYEYDVANEASENWSKMDNLTASA